MSLTRKTPQEFEERTLDWAIFRAPHLKIDFMGRIVPPNAVPHGYPLRRSILTHQPDSHVFEDTKEGEVDPPVTAIDRLKRRVSSANKHSMSITMRCALFRFPVFLWPKGGSKICCFDLEIIIPGPYQSPAVVSKYLEVFSNVFKKMTDVLKVRILLRVAKDQHLSPDPTLTHEEYLYSLFSSLGAKMESIRDLNVVIVQTLVAGSRKFQVHGLRGPNEMNFKLNWRDSLGSFDNQGNGLEICIRDKSGRAVRDSMGDYVRYHVGGVSRDDKGRLLLDFNGHLVRDSVTSNVRDSHGHVMEILRDGSMRDHYGNALRDTNNNVLHLGDRGELTDAAGNILLSNFAAAFNAMGYVERDSRENPIMQLPGDATRNSRGQVFVEDDNTVAVIRAANAIANGMASTPASPVKTSSSASPAKPPVKTLRHARSNITCRIPDFSEP